MASLFSIELWEEDKSMLNPIEQKPDSKVVETNDASYYHSLKICNNEKR